MKARWIPFLATTAALALAVVAPAQSRGHSRSGGGSERSRGSESSPRGRSSGDTGGSRSRDRSPSDRGSSRDRSSGDRSSGDRSSGPSRDRSSDRSPSGGGSSDSGQGRRNPFDRSRDRDRSPSSSPSNDQSRSRDRDRDGSPSSDQGRRDPFRRERGDRGRSSGGTGFPTGGGFPSRDRNDSRGGGDGRDSSPFNRSRGRSSHSGNVHYGSNYNGFGRVDRSNFHVGRVYNHVTLGEQIRRAGARPGYSVGFYGGLRLGYVHYNRYWRDDNFCYPFYAFDPWAPGVTIVCSPWYRYAYLPPYVNTTRVVVVNNYNPYWGWDGYDTYRYQDRRNLELNDALDDIRDAFEENSTRYAEHLLPESGQVAIFNDGKYDYSVGIDDFEDMFFDGVEQSKTVSYEILEVRTRGNEAKVRARHEFVDPYGDTQSVIHTFTLVREGGDYVIREFGTED